MAINWYIKSAIEHYPKHTTIHRVTNGLKKGAQPQVISEDIGKVTHLVKEELKVIL